MMLHSTLPFGPTTTVPSVVNSARNSLSMRNFPFREEAYKRADLSTRE
ncbi:MAG: hypothetical protein ACI8W3_000396 [Myxococcota bacterium]|jgi:hypothetical protein